MAAVLTSGLDTNWIQFRFSQQYQQGNSVGRPDLQRIIRTLATSEATKVAVVTSSTFSSTVYEYAAQFGSWMDLIDGDALIGILSESRIPPQ